MVVGYVFSRKDDKVYEVSRAGPVNEEEFEKKLYKLFKPIIWRLEG